MRLSDPRSTTGSVMRTPLLLGILCALAAPTVGAQETTVRRDPATGDYLVTIYDEDHRPVEIRLTPADQVATETETSVSASTPGTVLYEYSVRVLAGSRLPLFSFEVDCPAGSSVDALRASVPWDGRIRRLSAVRDDPSCKVVLGAAPLPVGNDPFTFTFETPLLPAIGEHRAIGATGAVRWPTSDPIPENAAAERFVRSINGLEGGWRSSPGVVPARAPEAFDAPALGLELLSGDLARVCGDLAWINHQGVCRSLNAKLEAAARAITRQRPDSAKGPLQAFLQELDAQHGPQPGKHVTDDAYALLRVNAERLLNAL